MSKLLPVSGGYKISIRSRLGVVTWLPECVGSWVFIALHGIEKMSTFSIYKERGSFSGEGRLRLPTALDVATAFRHLLFYSVHSFNKCLMSIYYCVFDTEVINRLCS